MTPNRILLCLIFLLFTAMAVAQKEAAQVRLFVQGFYDWYTPLASSEYDTHNDSEGMALSIKSSCFTPRLLRALRIDHQAEITNTTGYIVGYDADPFMMSQDPDERYMVGKIKRKGQTFWVDLHRVVDGKVLPETTAVAVVVEANGRYQFANFLEPKIHEDLLKSLNELVWERRHGGP